VCAPVQIYEKICKLSNGLEAIRVLEERLEKWKMLAEIYHRYLHEDEIDLEGDIKRLLRELGHTDCNDFLLSDYYHDPECIQHIVKELEVVRKELVKLLENR
jgi:hypothetical protein